MDIKEVNSGLLNLLLVNKNGAAAQSSDNGFGDLLAGLDFNPTLSAPKTDNADVKAPVKDKADKSSSFKEAAADRQISDSRPDYKADKAVSKDNKNNNDKAQTSDNKPANDDRSSNNKRPAADKTSDRGNKQPAEKNASAPEAVSQNETAPLEDGVEETADASDVLVVTLDALALMGTVTVINPQTNETMQVSGAELAQKLAAAGIEEVTLLPTEEGAAPVVVPVQEDSNVFADVLAEMQPVEPTKIEMVDSAPVETLPKTAVANDDAAIEVEDRGDQVVARQASEISEVIGKDRKAKIEVTVKEEKIAAPVDGSLLKNVKAVDDVVAAVMDNDGNPLLDNTDNLNGMNTSALNPAKDAAGTAQVVTPVVTAATVAESVKTAAADEAAPIVLSNASSAAGSELASAARTPAAANSETPSFKDVYKGMGKEVVDQIKVNITKSAVKGVDKIEIQLKPEDLGHIEVKMQIGKDGKLQAHIISSRPETAEILQKEMGNLQKAFSDAGFQTDEGSLSFSFRDDGQAGQNQEKNNLRNFIGDIMEQETALDAVSGDLFAGTAWDGKSALNIRV